MISFGNEPFNGGKKDISPPFKKYFWSLAFQASRNKTLDCSLAIQSNSVILQTKKPQSAETKWLAPGHRANSSGPRVEPFFLTQLYWWRARALRSSSTLLAILPKAYLPRSRHDRAYCALGTTGPHLQRCHLRRPLETYMFCDKVLALSSDMYYAATTTHKAKWS